MSPPTTYTESLEWEPITADHFQFVGYRNPERFFADGQRPLRLISTQPSVKVVENAIYTPATRAWKPFDGTIYDHDLRLVPQAVTYRGRTDLCVHSDPAQYQGSIDELAVYDRPLVYLGYMNQHYGHFLLESLARWWVLTGNCLAHGCRYLIHIHDPQILTASHVCAVLDAMHIEREDLVYFSTPTRLHHVFIPDVSLQLESHVYDAYRTLLNQLVTNVGVHETNTTDQPLYISRSRLSMGVREYGGEEELEQYLTSKGVHILYPEEYTFAEQVQFFNRHSRIIGIMGSGMHNVVLSVAPKTMVYLTPHKVVESCFLLDRCFDARSTYLQSCTDLDRFQPWIERFEHRILKMPKKRRHGFLQSYALDPRRVIRWFEQSSFFS